MATLFVKQLTVIDCSYLHVDRGLIGESWIVDVALHGTLDDQGMLFDFGDVKYLIKNVIDELADHKLIVPALSPQITVFNQDHGKVELEFKDQSGRRFLIKCPHQAVFTVQAADISTEGLQSALTTAIREVVPDNVQQIAISLRTETADAMYQYSHGLKKHRGNCQRIAHGHRSKIEIWENGQRSKKWEEFWVDRWRDIYIASEEDRVLEGEDFYRLAYTAEQGEFVLELPKSSCYFIRTDSTVEQIAAHLAEEMTRRQPNSRFDIRVFEGVNKGALAQAPA